MLLNQSTRAAWDAETLAVNLAKFRWAHRANGAKKKASFSQGVQATGRANAMGAGSFAAYQLFLVRKEGIQFPSTDSSNERRM